MLPVEMLQKAVEKEFSSETLADIFLFRRGECGLLIFTIRKNRFNWIEVDDSTVEDWKPLSEIAADFDFPASSCDLSD